MVKRSIGQQKVFETVDAKRHKAILGFDQRWFATTWQRMAGCGPTVVANILYYLQCTRQRRPGGYLSDPKSRLSFMEGVWKFVTPNMSGVSSAKMLYDGVLELAAANRIRLDINMLDIPKDKDARPPLVDILRYLDTALKKDRPVAFLNLNRGSAKGLDSWHWVTVVALEYEPDGRSASVEFLDAGSLIRIDFRLWYETTSMGASNQTQT
jgi:hypothetical protein